MRLPYIMTLGAVGLLSAALAIVPGRVVAASTTTDKAEEKMDRAGDKIDRAAEKVENKSEQMAEKAKDQAGHAKTATKDSWLTAKTKIALFADDRVKGRHVNVETKNGIVMLRGKIDSAEAKSAAEDIAKGIEGIKGVKNELQIVAPRDRGAIEAKDDDITKSVKQHIAKDSRLKNAGIDVKTNAGVVSLTGEVKNIDMSARASEVTRNTPGVRSVKNDLSLKDQK
jgi:hyperosmotically inducible protein